MHYASYQLTRETLGFCEVEDRRQLVTIPEGAIVSTVDEPPSSEHGFIKVSWQQNTISVYFCDLLDRGVPVSSHAG